MKKILYLLFFILCLPAFSTHAQIITTIAGTGTAAYGGDGGAATAAKLNYPYDISIDGNGNIYIADFFNSRIRRIDKNGIMTTVVGTTQGYSGDGGQATAAKINYPIGVASDRYGNLYISDYKNYRIRKVDTFGIITTIGGTGTRGFSGDGGPATAARIDHPYGIFVDSIGNVYFADNNNSRIRKIDAYGIITTIAGTGTLGYAGDGGPATAADIDPWTVWVDPSGNLYTGQINYACVRKISTSGIITTFAGTGVRGFSGDGGAATAAKVAEVAGITADSKGNIYLSDYGNSFIRKVTPSGIISTIAGKYPGGFSGDGGPATAAQLYSPTGLIMDPSNKLIICDYSNMRIREIVYNYKPVFTGGISRSIDACDTENFINNVLVIQDSNWYQTETWSAISGPVHGTLLLGTKISNGDTVVPTGFSYKPLAGYTGNDSFIVRVFDGYDADTIKIYVNVKVGAAPITGVAAFCNGQASAFSDATAGGTWSSSASAIAIVGSTGSVVGISSGTATISYTIANGCAATKIATVFPLPAAIAGNYNACFAQTTALSDTGGGTWSSSASSVVSIGSSSGLVMGISLGTAVVTYRLSTGCSTMATITVNPSPAVISGMQALCTGAAISLSCATTGGAWSSSNTAIASIGYTSGILTGNSIGTTTISYTLATGCGSAVSGTVQAPPAIAGGVPICAGQTVTLSSTFSGGTWSSSNTSVATVGSVFGSISGVAAGTAVITYLSPSGCLGQTTITVNPLPATIIGSPSVCIGYPTVLSNATAGGMWTSSLPLIASIGSATGLVSGRTTGTVTISYSLNTGCTSIMTVTVNYSPGSISGINRVCAGSTTMLSDGTPGAIWTSSNSTVATADPTTGIVTGVAVGTSVISYTLSTGCAATVIVSVNALPVAISGIATLCAGGTSSLSSGPGGGFWASSNTSVATVSSAGKVSGIIPGTSSVMYKIVTTGCSVSATVTITSVPTAISGLASVCTGNTTTLSDAVAGGAWTSSKIAIAIIDTGSGVLAGISSGTSVITYSLGAGCTITTVVTVNPMAAITGPSNICAGGTTILSDAVAGGAWSSSNTSVVTIGAGTGLVSGLSAGTTIVTYLLPSGCYSTKIITVNSAPPAITGLTNVCPGQTIVLSDAATGGTWSSSATGIATIGSATGVATGMAAGSANITYALGAGCNLTAILNVSALPAPITGPSNVCAGSAVVLSDATTGGTWSSAGIVVTVGPAIGIVTGIIAGTEIVTYTAGTGCVTTKIINVDPVPLAITGPNDVCVGKSVTLSDATTGGTWSASTGVVTVGLTTGIVTGVSAGTADITYTSTAGCTAAMTFTVNALPALITGPGAVCQGAMIILNDITPGGAWSSSSTGIATIDAGTGVVTGIAGGLANITYAASAGCVATKLIMVNSVSPVTGGTVVCVGKTTALSNAISGGTWSSSSAVVNVGSSSGIVTGVSSGTATVIYSLSSGCTSSAVITVNPLPSAGTISGASIVCATTAIFLSDAVTGGVWSTGSTTVNVTSGTGVVTGLSAGTALITYDVTNSCGTASTTHSLIVVPMPLAGTITGPDSVCAGATVTLSSATAGGVWSTAATTLSVGSVSGVVTGISKGTATISYAYTNICGTDIATSRMKVNPLPLAGVITGPTNVCVAASITLSDTITGGMWVKTNANASLAGNVVTGVTAGKDTIIYTNTNMCGSKATLTVITIDPLPDAGTIKGADHVCAGLTTILTDTAVGGAWSSSNIAVASIATTGVVTGLSAGAAVITYLATNVCGTDFRTLSFTVHPQPYAGIIYGADQVCVDKTITMTDSIAGGVWSNQHVNIASVADTIVTGLAAGIDTILYSYTNMCGTAVAKHGIIVNPLPNAGYIAGEKEVCIGSAILLTNDTTGGVWSTMSTTIAVADGNVTGVAVGTAIIDYAVTNMCGTAITDKIITVVPFPVVTEIFGAASVCEGATITLTDATIGGLWDSKHDMVQVVDGVVMGMIAGVDTVRYNVVNLCGVATARKEITVYPRPDAGVILGTDSVCAGDTIMLYNNATGGVWSMKSNIHTTLLQPSRIIGVSEGIDTVAYTVTNTCGQAISLFAVGVRSEKECQPYVADTIKHPFDCAGNGELIIYPNPNRGVFTLRIISDMQERMNVKIVNMLGQKVLQFPHNTNDPIELKLNLAPGTYIISVYNAHGHCAKKLTIE